MKLTESQIRQIIREELLEEGVILSTILAQLVGAAIGLWLTRYVIIPWFDKEGIEKYEKEKRAIKLVKKLSRDPEFLDLASQARNIEYQRSTPENKRIRNELRSYIEKHLREKDKSLSDLMYHKSKETSYLKDR